MDRTFALSLVALALAGCGDGVSNDKSLDALIRFRDANVQFFQGAMPSATDGPMVSGVDSVNNTIRIGQGQKAISGRLPKGASSVAVGFEGDVGYWVLPATVADPLVIGGLTFSGTASFSTRLTPGKHTLDFRAIDDAGKFGPTNPLVLTAQAAVPDGDLVISLSWDTQADLDLHVVGPDGIEVWSRKISTYKPPSGEDPDPAKEALAGVLDRDSNNQCVIDGRRLENVVWQKSAPSGHYLVRVDAFSLCGEYAARWKVEARRGVNAASGADGTLVVASSGNALDTDTRFDHVEGAGVLAAEFDL